MNLNSLPLIGGAAGSSLAQRNANTENTTKESENQARRTSADQKADKAAGIGATEGDAKAGDRDADGRRLWEQTIDEQRDEPTEPQATEKRPASRDPDGVKGNQLDLEG